ncbi:hypothetical protein [Streptomyces sp. NRRL WC-3742]|uniref:hypothetical protein n=1 Tax=Streptomyces sp. NRRL WC-3742 TaxID=1463934 RepID=UPI0004CB1E02|nr:hypothetical protein [Streptomyces sp. NRRL WC-3742]
MSDQNPYGAPQQPGYPAGTPQPGHGAPQPGYGEPQPQPGYPGAPGAPGAEAYPGYGGAYAPVPPQKKSRKGLWIALGIGGAVVLLGGGGVAYFAYDAVSNAGTQKVVLPAAFKDMKRNDDSPVTAAMEKAMTDSLGKGDGNWSPTGVAALYEDAQSQPKMIVAGAYGKILNPKDQLNQAFDGVAAKGSTIEGRHSVDAGPKGGDMECGTLVENGDTKIGICAWADTSSLVMVMNTDAENGVNPNLDTLAADTRDLRATAEIAK